MLNIAELFVKRLETSCNEHLRDSADIISCWRECSNKCLYWLVQLYFIIVFAAYRSASDYLYIPAQTSELVPCVMRFS